MVNWKASENIDRLIAVLIAAHPNFKLEYQAMAVLFGQGATYDAIEGRFRKYRKMAEQLKTEAAGRGITDLPRGRNNSASGSTTPRTPRGPRGGITKPSSCSSTGKSKKDATRSVASPTKRGSKKAGGRSLTDAIFLDDESGVVLIEEDARVKSEAAEILSGIGGATPFHHDMELLSPPTETATPVSKSEASIDPDQHSIINSSFSSPTDFGGVRHPDIANNGYINSSSNVPGPIIPAGCGLSDAHSTLDAIGMHHDAFDMNGLYFAHGNGGYDMDDSIYGGTA